MKKERLVSVLIYTKPTCPYCTKAKGYFDENKIVYQEIDVANDRAKHEELMEQTGSKTVPYIFINDRYIGGCSDMLKMAEDGGLEKALSSK